MKYRVTIEEREREVDVVITPDGGIKVSLDGTPLEHLDVERVPGGVSLRIGARMYDVAVGGRAESMQVSAGGARSFAQVISERARGRAKKAGTSAGGNELRAPMPGRVVKLLLAAGDSVSAGDPCVVIEAMKMENELRAPKDGKVAGVHVEEGASVESQALLVTFE